MAIRTLTQVAEVLKTQAKVGLRPGRNWPKAYITGDLYNSVKSTIKSSSDALSYTLSLSSLFYGEFIANGGTSIARYKAGPRPYNYAAVQSSEFGEAVLEYTKYQIDLKFQKAFKKSQREFGK
jgi:hypothetical protein